CHCLGAALRGGIGHGQKLSKIPDGFGQPNRD
ncbi:MAG: hypothetical protein ACI9HE_000559, partial [Planctomycetota bacterium]